MVKECVCMYCWICVSSVWTLSAADRLGGGGVGRRWQTRCKSFREILLTWCHIAYFDSPTATRRSCDVKKKTKKNKQHVDTFWCPWIHHLLNSDKHTHDMCQSWLRGLLFCFAQRDVSYGSHSKPQVFYATCGWGPGPPSFTLCLLWAHCSMLGKANKQKEMLFSSCTPRGAIDFIIFVSLEKKNNKFPYPLRSSWAVLLTGQLFLSTVTAMTEFFQGWTEQMDASNALCCWKCCVCWIAERLVAFCRVLVSKCVCDLRSRWTYITSYAAHLLWTSMESVQISGCVRKFQTSMQFCTLKKYVKFF